MIGPALLLAAIGLMFIAPLIIFILIDSKARHDAEEAYAVGYRDGQRAEFETQARDYVARQSAALQRRQAEEAARAYALQRGALG